MQVRIAPHQQQPLTDSAGKNKRSIPKEVEAALETHLETPLQAAGRKQWNRECEKINKQIRRK